jgi:hypothetical protein
MTDVRIATSAEQPINSDGAPSTVSASEGDLIGLNGDADIVAADAATGVQEPAVGVLATPVDDPADYPDESGQFNYARQQALANRATINNEKVGYVRYGVELVNEDADWGFTPGEPVYLGEGGGFTQTEPSDSGDLVQVLGYAIDAESVMLEIDADYTTVA